MDHKDIVNTKERERERDDISEMISLVEVSIGEERKKKNQEERTGEACNNQPLNDEMCVRTHSSQHVPECHSSTIQSTKRRKEQENIVAANLNPSTNH